MVNQDMEQVYDLGNGCRLIASREETINAIEEAERDLLSKAEKNEDEKMANFYQRVKTDTEFRQRRVVGYCLTKKLK